MAVSVVSTLALATTAYAYLNSQTDTTPQNEKSWLKTSDNTYVEYDFGTWMFNDDAWLKAEVNTSTDKYAFCYARYGTNGIATASGSTSNNFHAIAEVSGVDYFDSGSFSIAHNDVSYVRLEVE